MDVEQLPSRVGIVGLSMVKVVQRVSCDRISRPGVVKKSSEETSKKEGIWMTLAKTT